MNAIGGLLLQLFAFQIRIEKLQLSENIEKRPSCPMPAYDTSKRAEFGISGVDVFGWPGTGGSLIKKGADAVKLDFLGLDRFKESKRSWNAKEKDEFCKRLARVGAKRWSSEQAYIEVVLDMQERTVEQA